MTYQWLENCYAVIKYCLSCVPAFFWTLLAVDAAFVAVFKLSEFMQDK